MKTQQDIELMIQQQETEEVEYKSTDSIPKHLNKVVSNAQKRARASILRWVLSDSN